MLLKCCWGVVGVLLKCCWGVVARVVLPDCCWNVVGVLLECCWGVVASVLFCQSVVGVLLSVVKVLSKCC